MLLKNTVGLTVELSAQGAVSRISKGPILINLFLGNEVEGGIFNLFLRIRGAEGLESFPLTGPGRSRAFPTGDLSARWSGEVADIGYFLELRLAPESDRWLWTVRYRNNGSVKVSIDLVVVQDVGLAQEAAVLQNEAFTSQYIDHTVLIDPESGPVILSRQNQSQGGIHPWLLTACLEGAAGFLTDGFQFFGTGYKRTGIAEALLRPSFPSEVSQYEFSLPSLVSLSRNLGPNEEGTSTFAFQYVENHLNRSTPEDLGLLKGLRFWAQSLVRDEIWQSAVGQDDSDQAVPSPWFGMAPPLPVGDLNSEELEKLFGRRMRNQEWQDGKLISFFHGSSCHVVLAEKESLMERPHGNILLGTRQWNSGVPVTASTGFMYGSFHSHLCFGNTSFNKMLGVSRNALNVLKANGQRVFIRTEGGFRILGVPSAFEMSPFRTRWFYKIGRSLVVITCGIAQGTATLAIDVEGVSMEFLVASFIVAGETEAKTVPEITKAADGNGYVIRPAEKELLRDRHPEARFLIRTGRPESVDRWGGDGLLFPDGQTRGMAAVVVQTKAVSSFLLVMEGELKSEPASEVKGLASIELPRQQVQVTCPNHAVDRLNEVIPWLEHDACIHWLSPHGLEQYTGAAWGVRDVCQGPVEYLIAMGRYEEIRPILLKVFSRQNPKTGRWPQWFMFDEYEEIQQEESHGDVYLWPLAALCSFMEVTDSTSILGVLVPVTGGRKAKTVLDHIRLLMVTIQADFIPGVGFPRYGGGDWDDTLQPADPSLKDGMVSAWTVELLFQTLRRFETITRKAGLAQESSDAGKMAQTLGEKFQNCFLPGGVVAGFLDFRSPGPPVPLVHPTDTRSEIHYRLLPMTRGILSGLFTPDQARNHLQIIKDYLLFPDGVRLMDRPAQYRGGEQKYFVRAETAANFGREIGLLYVHATIRFAEAMARLGQADLAFWALEVVNPVGLSQVVPMAVPRQANAYFSSSDGGFSNRETAAKRFGELREGKVAVKGGWRVYSSGPGIYLKTWSCDLLGLRFHFDELVIDPVLPRKLDGLEWHCTWAGKQVSVCFSVGPRGYGVVKILVNGMIQTPNRTIENPYRDGGVAFDRKLFLGQLGPGVNQIEIELR